MNEKVKRATSKAPADAPEDSGTSGDETVLGMDRVNVWTKRGSDSIRTVQDCLGKVYRCFVEVPAIGQIYKPAQLSEDEDGTVYHALHCKVLRYAKAQEVQRVLDASPGFEYLRLERGIWCEIHAD